MTAPVGRGFDGVNRALLVGAALWSAALIVVGCLVSAAGGTIVQQNGPIVLVPLGVPLVAVAVVSLALALRRRPGAGPVAWTAAVALGVLALVGMLTIGLFVVPAAVLVVVACSRSQDRSPVPPFAPGAWWSPGPGDDRGPGRPEGPPR